MSNSRGGPMYCVLLVLMARKVSSCWTSSKRELLPVGNKRHQWHIIATSKLSVMGIVCSSF
eukprot:1150108-Pelagomonas_calceolata.AAC.4